MTKHFLCGLGLLATLLLCACVPSYRSHSQYSAEKFQPTLDGQGVLPPAPQFLETLPEGSADTVITKDMLEPLSTQTLRERFEARVQARAHPFTQAVRQQYIELELAKLNAFASSEAKLRAYLIDQLVTDRAVLRELAVKQEEPPISVAAVVRYLCMVRFNDPNALSQVYDQASATFAVWSERDAAEQTLCSASGGNCKIYEQDCSMGHVNVEETPFGAYGHLHLSPQDPSINCYGSEGFGRGDFSNCTPADYPNEDRIVSGHVTSHTMRLWLRDPDGSGAAVPFDIGSVRVLPEQPARISYRKSDGSWWYWANLPPANWNLSAWAWDITELRIRTGSEGEAVVFIDDIAVLRTVVYGRGVFPDP